MDLREAEGVTGPTFGQTVAEASATLAAAGVPSARLDAELLLASACGMERTVLYCGRGSTVAPEALQRFRAMLERRVAREPVAYILGRREFWSLDFQVSPAVLIPRPESELLVQAALAGLAGGRAASPFEKGGLREISPNDSEPKSPLTPLCQKGESRSTVPTICDVGTGSGCLAIALATEMPDAAIWALDVSPTALDIAAANARRHSVDGRVRFFESELFAAVTEQRFDVIVCNPPYVASTELADLEAEIGYEPRLALDGGEDGLAVIRGVVAAVPRQLRPGGRLIVEIGSGQGRDAARCAEEAGLTAVEIRRDYAGLERMLIAQA
jgi:release factor glutamine methyltransferase